MLNLKQTAQGYQPKVTHNVADLDIVDLSWPIEERSGNATKKNKEGVEYEEEYFYKVIIVGNLEYRVPNAVLEEIKKMVALVPELQFVKVSKTGIGKATKYSVEKAEPKAEEQSVPQAEVQTE